jgi:diguanylate cyclase (GGDEF)-like protein
MRVVPSHTKGGLPPTKPPSDSARLRTRSDSAWFPRSKVARGEVDAALLHALTELAQARSAGEARKRANALREWLEADPQRADADAEDSRAWGALLDAMVARARECDRLRRLAGSDELTAIANRRVFNDALRRELSHSTREHRPLALLMFDLDGLKAINDQHGHAAGDRALRAVARCASAIVRHGDLVARIGGDEFAVLLPNTDAGKAAAVARRIRQQLRDVDVGDFAVRLSIGIAVAHGSNNSRTALLREADADLYRDKLARKTLRATS